MAGGVAASPTDKNSSQSQAISPTDRMAAAYDPRVVSFTPANNTSSIRPASIYNATPIARSGFYQPGTQTQLSTAYLPQQISGYGNFTTPAARQSFNHPTADQVRNQIGAYQQQYVPQTQAAQQDVQAYVARLRQAEVDRKAEIARKEAEAKAKAEAERLAQEAAMQNSGDAWGSMATAAQGGLASLQGFTR